MQVLIHDQVKRVDQPQHASLEVEWCSCRSLDSCEVEDSVVAPRLVGSLPSSTSAYSE